MHFAALEDVPVASTAPEQLCDITDALAARAVASGVGDGVLHVWCPHTSCGLAVTEAEDGLHADLSGLLERLAPLAGPWVHDDRSRRTQNLDDDRVNGHSHMRALLATVPTLTLPVRAGVLAVGRWQRVFLVELDGPRDRCLVASAWGTPGPGSDVGERHRHG